MPSRPEGPADPPPDLRSERPELSASGGREAEAVPAGSPASSARSPAGHPAPRPRARRVDRFLRGLSRLVLAVFYRRVEVVGTDRIPRDCPLMVVANHTNGLVDPVLIVGTLRIPARFLAKSTLWKIPVLRSLIDLAGAIPVYRPQDQVADRGVDPTQNEATFARCHEVLAAGGAVALFPEGTSHSQPALKPLKTGAARIVLEAERKFGPLGVKVLPVGFFFESKGKFRSRALVQVGDPFGAEAEVSLYIEEGRAGPVGVGGPGLAGQKGQVGQEAPRDQVGHAGQEAVRALTGKIEDALEEVTLNYASWEDGHRIARAADLYARPALDVPRGRRLGETFAIRRAFLAGYPAMRERFPERTAALAAAVEAYDRLLKAAGVSDEQVASRYAPSPVLGFLARSLVRLLVHLPLAAVGTLLNVVPFWLVRLIALKVRHAPDQQATFKVFPSLVLYPLAWAAEAVAVARWAGRAGWEGAGWWGVLTFLLALPSGYAAILFHERRRLLWRESRAFLKLRTRGRLAAELRARREEVYREVENLVGEYRKIGVGAGADGSGGREQGRGRGDGAPEGGEAEPESGESEPRGWEAGRKTGEAGPETGDAGRG